MKDKVIIGKLTSRKLILLDLISGLIGYVGVYYFLISLFKGNSFFQTTPYALGGMKIALVLIYMIATIVGLSTYGSKQYIEIDKTHLSYYATTHLKDRYLQSFRLIFNQPQIPDLQIKINDIDHFTLLYSDVYMGWAQKGHSIIFNITLKDGTLIRIMPDNLYFEKQNCLRGLEYIEQLGIHIDDPYHIKDALQDTTMRFAEYIEKVRKDNET
ncbi:hypothetical protein [Candidatus Stoquefichus sp. SB1]|uniref:hypothetical protein n=1 Tax=Candidatus Stoquefichus sp. SB1 TaxID=1658109 RepID=UPI00067EF84C|nr:hypothetical protein [Candidatus Stoquefichus sp. SB1]